MSERRLGKLSWAVALLGCVASTEAQLVCTPDQWTQSIGLNQALVTFKITGLNLGLLLAKDSLSQNYAAEIAKALGVDPSTVTDLCGGNSTVSLLTTPYNPLAATTTTTALPTPTIPTPVLPSASEFTPLPTPAPITLPPTTPLPTPAPITMPPTEPPPTLPPTTPLPTPAPITMPPTEPPPTLPPTTPLPTPAPIILPPTETTTALRRLQVPFVTYLQALVQIPAGKSNNWVVDQIVDNPTLEANLEKVTQATGASAVSGTVDISSQKANFSPASQGGTGSSSSPVNGWLWWTGLVLLAAALIVVLGLGAYYLFAEKTRTKKKRRTREDKQPLVGVVPGIEHAAPPARPAPHMGSGVLMAAPTTSLGQVAYMQVPYAEPAMVHYLPVHTGQVVQAPLSSGHFVQAGSPVYHQQYQYPYVFHAVPQAAPELSPAEAVQQS